MPRILLAVLITLAVFFVAPFPFYAAASALTGLEPPEGASPAVFMLSVLIQKAGHATVFVLLFAAARDAFRGRWPLYAALWWTLFAADETGMAVGPEYSWTEAVAGILAEAVYFPAAAWITHRLLTKRAEPETPAG